MTYRNEQHPDKRPLSDRFWEKVDTSGDCWVWTAACEQKGYGRIVVNGKARKAHRIAYELTYGPIPDGMVACHRCDNPPCVRPDHLFLGTILDNTLDALQKGRLKNGFVGVLTDDQAREGLALFAQGYTRKSIARHFGVSIFVIERLVRRTTYRHVK